MSLPLRAFARSSIATHARLSLRAAAARPLIAKAFFSSSSGSITYSGGQASEGQGGFYGSGGARAEENSGSHLSSEEERKKMVAMAADVQSVTHVIAELETLEHILEREEADSPGQVSGRVIEIKSSMKKLMTSHDFSEVLGRLTFNGSPVWGLSMKERALVDLARDKVNEC